MPRRALVAAVLLLAACHHKKRPAYAADGSCPDPDGCEPARVYPNEYRPPDEDHAATGGDPWGPGPAGELPQASCDDVAHALASIELGNWADEEALAPAIAKHRAACTKARLDEDERQCIFEATDKDAIAWCAPRMVPGAQIATVAAKDCESILTTLRAQATLYQPSQPIVEKQVGAIAESCTKDRWTIPFGDCVRNLPYPTYVSAYCAGAAPLALRKKIESRLAQVK